MIPPLLFQLMILLSWPINALAESPAIAKRGCRTLCINGNVSIPFPFGIGAGCYLDDWYEVTCNSSTPILKSINLEVLNISISLEASTILVNHPVLHNCTGKGVRKATVNLESSPFFFSDANRFTGVGCNNFAYLSSNSSIISGCISFCNKKDKSEKKKNIPEPLVVKFLPVFLPPLLITSQMKRLIIRHQFVNVVADGATKEIHIFSKDVKYYVSVKLEEKSS
ncbi:hypothetical protein LWI29_023265 [Acer saccharum]|uniref:Wall-associated receptor kinase galacturonan-binding domain-containing protein n=1 Tax=Acer saccharum TaxID=4024 RepID=A0AA39SHK2_ACESA|nr:hypothetical protein LWI29_023265 [Acer saccharum]